MLKWLGYALVGVVALVMLLWLYISLFFDPNDYEPELEAAFEQRTGRALDLQGGLNLELFPWFGIETGRAVVANAPGFGDEPFIAVERVRAGVRVLPLLQDRIEIGKVEVDGLELELTIADDGNNNWADLFSADAPPDSELPSQDQPTESGRVDLSVAGLEVVNARVAYEDRRSDSRYELRDFSLQTGAVGNGAPVEFSANGLINLSGEPLAEAGLQGVIQAEPDRLTIEEPRGTLRLASYGPNGTGLESALSARAIEVETATNRVAVSALRIDIGAAQLRSELRVDADEDGLIIEGPLEMIEADPRQLIESLGVAVPLTRDPEVLKSMQGRADFGYAAGVLEIKGLQWRLDDTTVRGSAFMRPSGSPKFKIDLAIDRLDLDRYLSPQIAPVQKTSGDEASTGGGSQNGRIAEVLRDLDLDGRLRVDTLKAGGIDVGGLEIGVKADPGIVKLDPVALSAFGGKITAPARIDATSERPVMMLEPRVSDVDMEALLAHFLGIRQLTGRGSGKARLQASGSQLDALIATLAGSYDFNVRDGTLVGADLWYEMQKAAALATGKMPPTGRGTGRTEFQRLDADGRISDSTLRNRNFRFVSDFFKVKGAGDVHYDDGRLDLKFEARLTRAPEGSVKGFDFDRLVGVEVPVAVGGTLTEPEVSIEAAKLIESVATRAIDKAIEEKLDELIDVEEVKEKLKGLFGR